MTKQSEKARIEERLVDFLKQDKPALVRMSMNTGEYSVDPEVMDIVMDAITQEVKRIAGPLAEELERHIKWSNGRGSGYHDPSMENALQAYKKAVGDE